MPDPRVHPSPTGTRTDPGPPEPLRSNPRSARPPRLLPAGGDERRVGRHSDGQQHSLVAQVVSDQLPRGSSRTSFRDHAARWSGAWTQGFLGESSEET